MCRIRVVTSSVSSGESDYSGFSDNVRMHRASPSQSRLGSDNSSGNNFRVSPSLPFKIPQVMVDNELQMFYNILLFSIVV